MQVGFAGAVGLVASLAERVAVDERALEKLSRSLSPSLSIFPLLPGANRSEPKACPGTSRGLLSLELKGRAHL